MKQSSHISVATARSEGLQARLRVLICDFDFFSAVAGGQVFYRRTAGRNPDLSFHHPSRADVRLKAQGTWPEGFQRVLSQ